MATLQVRDIDDRLYDSLKTEARMQNRSISQEVVSILESFLANPKQFDGDATDAFVKLAGSWQDERDEKVIVKEMCNRSTSATRFGSKHVLFD